MYSYELTIPTKYPDIVYDFKSNQAPIKDYKFLAYNPRILGLDDHLLHFQEIKEIF